MEIIPYIDLAKQYQSIKTEIDSAILNLLNQGNYILGEEVAEFEKNYASFCNANYAIGLNSGTSALHLALLALGIGPGDEVITVSMTFVATVAAILYVGAKPVLIDVDNNNWNINTKLLESVITPRTKAIIPVHFHGLIAPMKEIVSIAKKYNLFIIEDACQAHGAQLENNFAGTWGDVGCFSFYPAKNLGCYGEGGAVVTAHQHLAEKIKKLRNFGQSEKYNHELHGFNYRLETLQAAILNVKLKYLHAWTTKRIQIAAWYREGLQNYSVISLPVFYTDYQHVYHVFAIRVRNRDAIQKALLQRGIITNIQYPRPVHLQPAYVNDVTIGSSLQVSETLADEFLSLPIYPELTRDQVDYICVSLVEVISSPSFLKKVDARRRGDLVSNTS